MSIAASISKAGLVAAVISLSWLLVIAPWLLRREYICEDHCPLCWLMRKWGFAPKAVDGGIKGK